MYTSVYHTSIESLRRICVSTLLTYLWILVYTAAAIALMLIMYFITERYLDLLLISLLSSKDSLNLVYLM